MPIDFVTGDIFQTSMQTIAHGCNCRGRMGAGIALDGRRNNFCQYYEQQGITSLALPRIGAGLGGLEWTEVRSLIIKALDPLPISIMVYESL